MKSFKEFIKDNFIVGLSPMDGITDEPFRLVQTKIAKPDVTFTEFASAEGLTRGGVKLYDILLYKTEERPIIGQLFGKDPEGFYKAALVLCHLGFDGVDVNMGCPAKTVTQNGSGAALINQPELASKIIKSVQKAVSDWLENKITIKDIGLNLKTLKVIERNLKYTGLKSDREKIIPTISVKTRLGVDKPTVESWFPHLLSHDLDFITLHGRTLKQGYSGIADWDNIALAVKLAKDTKTLIWGNGDIQSKSQALEMAKKNGVSGVLIGRAAMGNPWVFTNYTALPQERFSAMLLHAQTYSDVFPKRCFDSLRKHFLLYTSGLTNAKHLRADLIRLKSVDELLSLECEFLNC